MKEEKFISMENGAKKQKRISWDDYWMTIVFDIAKRSTCLRRQIGALIVKDNIIVSTGYNGAPRSFSHCLDSGCRRDKLHIPSGEKIEECIAVHAEQNALLQAGRMAIGGVLYVNCFPCKVCSRLIINSGIMRTVISGDYPDKEGLELLKKAKIEVSYLIR